MPRRSIQVRLFPEFRAVTTSARLRQAAKAALEVGDPDGLTGASVVIADDETLRDLNRRFRGLDEVTDVLSFEDAAGTLRADGGEPFPAVSEADASLGEVIISYPQAARQATERGEPVAGEVALLVVHGVLHLLGHDHAEPGEEARMQALERQALDRILFRPRPEFFSSLRYIARNA